MGIEHPSEYPEIPTIACSGILFFTDIHLAGTPPGQRLPGYTEQTLAKLAFCLEQAVARDLLPVICGDLFHWPRENPNTLLIRCIELFKPLAETPLKCWVLVGNHDKWQANYTDDVSMAVLESAGVIHVMKTAGPQCRLAAGGQLALLGASPDMSPLPKAVERHGEDTVLWVSHHGLGFPDYADQRQPLRELPGVDWLINGHLHQPQPPQRRGMTTWVNIGSLTRMSFAPRVKERRPAAAIWRPGATALERLEVPFLPFEEVFPDQPFPEMQVKEGGESLFLKGLERLTWRRTHEGAGLRQFLEDNLDPALPESTIILKLYEEISHGGTENA
ncbi:metallophosphoesterase family protein [Megalodesulfovibrio paquesii]